MHTLEELCQGKYRLNTVIKLHCALESFPMALLDCEALEMLDLSGNRLSLLPKAFSKLRTLRVFFASDNQFEVYPDVLGEMPGLQMVAFKNNQMHTIHENALHTGLKWLILTNNKLTSLPKSLGHCTQVQKLMLAGNLLCSLPDEMSRLNKLELLRLSMNNFRTLPAWLFELPSLAFLGFAGNPIIEMNKQDSLSNVPWADLRIQGIIGEGASGTIFKALWNPVNTEVAVKLFKGSITSDGSPADEMRACIAAGQHPNLIDTVAEITDHPAEKSGLVLQLIPTDYVVLAAPPSLASCTRDCFQLHKRFALSTILKILRSIASAASHLHGSGLSHGDLYAHNTLVDKDGHALLGDFGAATVYGVEYAFAGLVQRLEVRAFGYMIQDLLERRQACSVSRSAYTVLHQLQHDCLEPHVKDRPSFSAIYERLTIH